MSTATTLPFQRHATLGMSVLVLNRSFVAVHVTNVRRALALLFRDVAEVVHILTMKIMLGGQLICRKPGK